MPIYRENLCRAHWRVLHDPHLHGTGVTHDVH
jgi:hypothetical protein